MANKKLTQYGISSHCGLVTTVAGFKTTPDETATGATEVAFTVPKAAGVGFGIDTEPLGQTLFNSGTLSLRLNVTTADPDVTLSYIRIVSRASDCGGATQWGADYSIDAALAAGVVQYDIYRDTPLAVTAGDRLEFYLQFQNPSHQDGIIGITPSETVDTPFPSTVQDITAAAGLINLIGATPTAEALQGANLAPQSGLVTTTAQGEKWEQISLADVPSFTTREVHFSQDGKYLAAFDLIYSASSGVKITQLSIPGFVRGLEFSHDSTKLAIGCDISASLGLHLYNTGTWDRINAGGVVGGFAVYYPRWSPDDGILALRIASGGNELRLLKTDTWTTATGAPSTSGTIQDIRWRDDSALLAVAIGSDNVRFYNGGTFADEASCSPSVSVQINEVHFEPSGTRALVLRAGTKEPLFYSSTDGGLEATATAGTGAISARFMDSGEKIGLGYGFLDADKFKFMDPATYEASDPGVTATANANIESVAFSPSGDRLAIGYDKHPFLSLWKRLSGISVELVTAGEAGVVNLYASVGIAAEQGGTQTVTITYAAEPGAGAISEAGQVAALLTENTLAASAGETSEAGYAPTVDYALLRVLSPAVGVESFAGYSATLQVGNLLQPAAGMEAHTGYAPALLVANTIHPSSGLATSIGYAPDAQNVLDVAVQLGEATEAGYAPLVPVENSFSPIAGEAAEAGFAPSLEVDNGLAPSAGLSTEAGYAPTAEATTEAIDLQPQAGIASMVRDEPYALDIRAPLPGPSFIQADGSPCAGSDFGCYYDTATGSTEISISVPPEDWAYYLIHTESVGEEPTWPTGGLVLHLNFTTGNKNIELQTLQAQRRLADCTTPVLYSAGSVGFYENITTEGQRTYRIPVNSLSANASDRVSIVAEFYNESLSTATVGITPSLWLETDFSWHTYPETGACRIEAGYAPVISIGTEATVSPSVGIAAAAGEQAGVTLTLNLEPSAGRADQIGYSPATLTGITLEAQPGAADEVGSAPILGVENILTPETGLNSQVGASPSPFVDNLLTPSTGVLDEEGRSAVILVANSLAHTAGACAATGQAPSVVLVRELDIAPAAGLAVTVGGSHGVAGREEALPSAGYAVVGGLEPEVRKIASASPITGIVASVAGRFPVISTGAWAPPEPPVNGWSSLSAGAGTWTPVSPGSGGWTEL